MISTLFTLSCSILLLLLVNIAIADHAEPLDVQVDILFPQNNTVYQPVYPFPILFAYHNFTLAWQYKPIFKWWLVRQEDDPKKQRHNAKGLVGYGDPSKSKAPPDQYFPMNSTKAVSQWNESTWELNYYFSIGGNQECNSSMPGSTALQAGRGGKIVFQTSVEHGLMPDIFQGIGVESRSGGWPCAQPLLRMGITTQEARMRKGYCLEEEEPRPEPVACALRVDVATKERIVDEMTKRSGCSAGVTWPHGTGIGTKCGKQWTEKEKSGAGSRLRWSTSGILVTIGMMCLSMCMASSRTILL